MTIEFPEEGLTDDVRNFVAAKKAAGAKRVILHGSRAKNAEHKGNDVDLASEFEQPGRKIIQHQRQRGSRSKVLISNRDVTSELAKDLEDGFITQDIG